MHEYKIEYYYDINNRLTGARDHLGTELSYSYDSSGNLIGVKSQAGKSPGLGQPGASLDPAPAQREPWSYRPAPGGEADAVIADHAQRETFAPYETRPPETDQLSEPKEAPIEWFISRKGNIIGPYSREQIEEMLSQGSINTDDMIWNSAYHQWMPAKRVTELLDHL